MSQDLLARVREELECNASPEIRASQLRFHKPNEHPPSYGIMAPKLRAMARDLYPAVKKLAVPGSLTGNPNFFQISATPPYSAR